MFVDRSHHRACPGHHVDGDDVDLATSARPRARPGRDHPAAVGRERERCLAERLTGIGRQVAQRTGGQIGDEQPWRTWPEMMVPEPDRVVLEPDCGGADVLAPLGEVAVLVQGLDAGEDVDRDHDGACVARHGDRADACGSRDHSARFAADRGHQPQR